MSLPIQRTSLFKVRSITAAHEKPVRGSLQQSPLAVATARCAPAVWSRHRNAGALQVHWPRAMKLGPVTMVTCDAGKKVNFPHGCVVYELNIPFAVRCKHVPFSSTVKAQAGFVCGFVAGSYCGCANSAVPACKGWLLRGANLCCTLRWGRGLTEHGEILGSVLCYLGDFLLKKPRCI